MSVDQHDPEAVVRAAAAAMHEERWRDAALLCSAESLAERRAFALRLVGDLRPTSLTWEQYRRMMADAPEEVARWQWQQIEAEHGKRDYADEQLAALGVRGAEELAALDPVEYYARHLAAQAPRRQNAAMLDAMDASPRLRAWFAEHEARHPLLVVLGHVREGERLAHVVVREQHAGVAPPAEATDPVDASEAGLDLGHASAQLPVRLVTLARDDDGRWWLEASHELLGFGGTSVTSYEASDVPDAREAAEWEGEPPDD